jgi:hypothetical protein
MSIENKTEQEESKEILCPKAGTATLSSVNKTTSTAN